MAREITIIGGGLAGLALGILLRQRRVPVEVIEAGSYPRHRVCGEFMSGRGAGLLRELAPEIEGCEGRSARFFVRGKSSRILSLPEPALCISREVLDAALARRFEELGGGLRTGTRWTGGFDKPGVVRATGRRLRNEESSLVGFKAHAHGFDMDTTLELHFSRAGYVGISQLPDGMRNVCGLFRREGLPADCRANPLGAFAAVVGDRLRKARVESASCSSVAGLRLDVPRWGETAEFSLGDSITVIPPLTGNGMSLALESAVLAVEPIEKFAHGEMSWHESSDEFSQLCKDRFRLRLVVSSFLQKLAVSDRGQSAWLSCLKTAPVLWPVLFRLTR